MARVYITRALTGNALERLRAEHDVSVWDGELPPPPEALRAAVADVEGLLCLLTERVDRQLLDAAPRLRAIANYAVGTDNIDLALTHERGIPVGVTPDVLTEATADLAFALLLAAARNLFGAVTDARAGGWRTWEPAGWLGADVHGAALGIVGLGRIGRSLASSSTTRTRFFMRGIPGVPWAGARKKCCPCPARSPLLSYPRVRPRSWKRWPSRGPRLRVWW